MIVVGTGFIPLSPLVIVGTMNIWKCSQWFGIGEITPQSMDKCAGRRVIAKILLNKALNTIQSIKLGTHLLSNPDVNTGYT